MGSFLHTAQEAVVIGACQVGELDRLVGAGPPMSRIRVTRSFLVRHVEGNTNRSTHIREFPRGTEI
eukprot:COSAG02_NODE_7131_length_3166_cov_1.967069_1_plen_66_part_00